MAQYNFCPYIPQSILLCSVKANSVLSFYLTAVFFFLAGAQCNRLPTRKVFSFHDPVLCVLVVGQYQDPWQYVDDIWLMFNNAWLYNRKTSRVYKYCSKLAEVFEQEIDPVMQSLGYCCGRKVRECQM